jgi:simple sugar transport system permease protein
MSVLAQVLNASVFAAMLRMATPLILGGLGSVFSERSGILNLGIEGVMLISAFVAAITSLVTQSAWLGVLGGMLIGGLMGLFHAFLCIKFQANQTVVGMGINIFATGITPLLLQAYWGNPGSTPTVPGLSSISIPILKDIPILGSILGTHSPLTYLALLLVPVSTFVLFRTKFGLRVRSVGEHPRAADTLGVNVYLMQYLSVMICGMLAGIGGAYLSLCQVSMFVKGMTSGRGFMAMATMIFGKWHPVGVLLASLLFGFADGLQMAIQAAGWNIPSDILLCLPYILTILALAGFVGKAEGPKQVGKPYVKC